MQPRSVRKNRHRNAQPLYPLMLSAFGLALLGGFWALQGPSKAVDSDPVEAAQWEDVQPYELERPPPLEWNEPLSLNWDYRGRLTSQLRMRQHEQDESARDVELVFRADMEVAKDGDERLVQNHFDPLGLKARYGEEPVQRDVYRQLNRGLSGAQVEWAVDDWGQVQIQDWTDHSGPKSKPGTALVVAMQQLLIPRLPRQSVIVGEGWSYEIPLEFTNAALDPPVEIRVKVEETLAGVHGTEHRPLAVIERELTLELADESPGSQVAMKAQGRGTAFFDIDAGRLVDTQLTVHRTSAGPQGRELATEMDAVWRINEP